MALKHLESLAADDFAVCDAVLTEACFHLPHPNQRQRLRALLRDLSVQPIPIMHELDFFLEVRDWLTKYANQEPDWANACLAILSGPDKDLKIWTYDRECKHHLMCKPLDKDGSVNHCIESEQVAANLRL